MNSTTDQRDPSRSPQRHAHIYPDLSDRHAQIYADLSDSLNWSDDEEVELSLQFKYPHINPVLPENISPSATTKSKTPAPPSRQNHEERENSWIPWMVVFFAVVIAVACILKCYSSDEASTKPKANCSTILDIKKHFPNQDKKLFKALYSGINGLAQRNPTEPSVFTLFSTDVNTINSIIKEVVHAAKYCIDQPNDPIYLTVKDLSTQRLLEDGTLLLVDLKDELVKRSVMIVNDLDEIPMQVVPSLHSICDTYNPLVAKSFIIFTIKIDKKPKGKPIEYITQHLENRWESLPSNIRGPLIARVLDQTFFVVPEKM